MSIEFRFLKDSDKRTVAQFRGAATAIERAVMEKMNQLDVELQRKIQSKLEGDVLHSHTHKLANSVRVIPARKEGRAIVGYVQAGGGPAWYARVQEFGAKIPEVSGKLMVFPGALRTAMAMSLGKARTRQIMGRSGGMVFTMRHKAFDLPPKPFMGPSFEEMKPRFISEIQQTINEMLGRSE